MSSKMRCSFCWLMQKCAEKGSDIHVMLAYTASLQLGQVLHGIHNPGPTEISALLSQVAALQSALATRPLSMQNHHQPIPTADRLLTVQKAASRLGTSEDGLYHHAPKVQAFRVD
jgi:hypothetical protein